MYSQFVESQHNKTKGTIRYDKNDNQRRLSYNCVVDNLKLCMRIPPIINTVHFVCSSLSLNASSLNNVSHKKDVNKNIRRETHLPVNVTRAVIGK